MHLALAGTRSNSYCYFVFVTTMYVSMCQLERTKQEEDSPYYRT